MSYTTVHLAPGRGPATLASGQVLTQPWDVGVADTANAADQQLLTDQVVQTGAITPVGQTQLPELERATGVIIPFYEYPANVYSNAKLNAVIATIKAHHRIPTMVVLNPGSGPGTVTDGNYAAAIKRLQGAGARVLGYVHTTHAARPLADVKTDVDTWLTLYPLIDGIFIDEMTNDDSAAHRAYFAQLTSYIHQRGLFPSVGNPGSGLVDTYFTQDTADIIVIYESSGPPDEATLKGDYDGGYSDISFRRRAALIYDATQVDPGAGNYLAPEDFAVAARYLGWLYVTSDAAPNPWDALDTAELDAIYTSLADTTA